MKTKNHTPGPWALLDREENSRKLTHITSGAHIVCTLGTTRTDGSPNHYTNANLIAGAPDMFDALQAIVDAFGDQDSLLIDQCKASLAKAKGE